MEISMCLMLGLTRVVNHGRLVEPLDWLLLYSTGRYIICQKTLLDQVVYPTEYFHSAIVLYTYQYYNEMKSAFEPHTHYCHMRLACTSVCYERDMHVLII